MTVDAISSHVAAVRAGATDTSASAVPGDTSADVVTTVSTVVSTDVSTDVSVGGTAVGGAVHDLAGFVLVASVEPRVVFSSLAEQCVPELCDECTIDIVDGPRARYGIAYPPSYAMGGGLRRIAVRAAAALDHRIRVSFAPPASIRAWSDQTQDERSSADPGEFHGVATFVWHYRMPTRADRTMVAVLTDHAMHTVLWQRSEHAASAALISAAHLRVALQTNRDIGAAVGILMSQHKSTQDEALELLRTVSQHCNRKLHDLALDVIDTGWLDPALLAGRPRIRRPSGGRGAGKTLSETETRHD